MKSYYAKDCNQWLNWLTKHAAREKEVWLIYYKKHSRKPSITHEDAVRAAICYGWIDGVIRRLDAERTARRFSPRHPGSRWSALNIRRAQELIRSGEITPAGLAAFRPENKAATPPRRFSSKLSQIFKKNGTAWRNFQLFPAYYRRLSAGWVESAKKPETRMKRLQQLINFSAANQIIDFMASASKQKRPH